MAPVRLQIVFVLGLGTLLSSRSVAQESEPLPEGWQDLPTAEFVALALQMEAQGTISSDAGNQVLENAATRLKNTSFSQISTTEYPVLEDLHRLGWKRLNAEERARIRNEILARVDDWQDRPYDEARGKVMMLIRVKQPLAAYMEARKWVAAGGTLDKVRESAKGLEDLKHPLAPVAINVALTNGAPIYGRFSVTWEARIVPPQTGEYVFSISRININADYRGYSMEKSMRVLVGGQEVVNATPQHWESEGQPVSLTADEPVDLRVELTTGCPPDQFPHGVLHAILSWRGPGMNQSVVPKDRLRMPDSEDLGIRGTYSWTRNGQEQSITQRDSAIDFLWAFGGLAVAPGHVGESAAIAAVAKSAWQNSISADALAALEASGQTHSAVNAADAIGSMLSTAERQDFLQALLDHPGLLDPVNAGPFWRFYRVFHVGALDTANEVFGVWARKHADVVSDMPNSIFSRGVGEELRQACRNLSVCFFHETPEEAETLRQFLPLPDGGCCLPVAYSLGYGYHTQDRLQEWTDYLDAKLADGSVTGDKRVNWLLARAHAHEIRLGTKQPYAILDERVMDGRRWVEEALTAASSLSVKARVARELAARLVTVHRFNEARDVLNGAGEGAPAEIAAQLTGDRQKVDGLESAYTQDRTSQAAKAKASYIRSLQRMRDKAAGRGDDDAVNSYDAAISAASGN